MEFNDDETKKMKAMLLYLVRKRYRQSDGKCGFRLLELTPILEQMVKEGDIEIRPTINDQGYFLTNFNKDQ